MLKTSPMALLTNAARARYNRENDTDAFAPQTDGTKEAETLFGCSLSDYDYQNPSDTSNALWVKQPLITHITIHIIQNRSPSPRRRTRKQWLHAQQELLTCKGRQMYLMLLARPTHNVRQATTATANHHVQQTKQYIQYKHMQQHMPGIWEAPMLLTHQCFLHTIGRNHAPHTPCLVLSAWCMRTWSSLFCGITGPWYQYNDIPHRWHQTSTFNGHADHKLWSMPLCTTTTCAWPSFANNTPAETIPVTRISMMTIVMCVQAWQLYIPKWRNTGQHTKGN